MVGSRGEVRQDGATGRAGDPRCAGGGLQKSLELNRRPDHAAQSDVRVDPSHFDQHTGRVRSLEQRQRPRAPARDSAGGFTMASSPRARFDSSRGHSEGLNL